MMTPRDLLHCRPTARRPGPGLVAVALSLVVGLAAGSRGASAVPGAGDQRAPMAEPAPRIGGVELLGSVSLPSGGTVLGTPLGGLSAITYDAAQNAYYAQSDDRSQRAAARFYGLTVDLADGRLGEGDITFTRVVTLTDQAGQTLPAGVVDPEGIALSPTGTVYVSSEGDASATPPHVPWVAEFSLAGRWQASAPVPEHFLPGPGKGVRNNLAFEPLTISPGGTRLVTATEAALAQDGPTASASTGSRSRLLLWSLPRRDRVAEYVYPVAPWPVPPSPSTAFADNGLVELIALDEGRTYLAMERSFATGVGVTARLFETSAAGATDVSGLPALTSDGFPLPFEAMSKRQVADIGALGVTPDNLEGMTFGPTLPDGRRVLLLVSDDNFSAAQVTQFVALAVEIETGPRGTCFLPFARR